MYVCINNTNNVMNCPSGYASVVRCASLSTTVGLADCELLAVLLCFALSL